MPSVYESNREFSDRFLPEILQIVKDCIPPYIIASPDDDRYRATDLISVKAGPTRIAARVRRAEDYMKFKDQFTIRSRREFGETELSKIVAGWGDYFIYGFGPSDGGRLCRWTLCRLDIFRAWFKKKHEELGLPPGPEMSNGDGTYFRWYRWKDIATEHPDFVVATFPQPPPPIIQLSLFGPPARRG